MKLKKDQSKIINFDKTTPQLDNRCIQTPCLLLVFQTICILGFVQLKESQITIQSVFGGREEFDQQNVSSYNEYPTVGLNTYSRRTDRRLSFLISISDFHCAILPCNCRNDFVPNRTDVRRANCRSKTVTFVAKGNTRQKFAHYCQIKVFPGR